MKTIEIAALSLCDGLGQPDNTGSYVFISIKPNGEEPTHYRISKGGAEKLADEITGVLRLVERQARPSVYPPGKTAIANGRLAGLEHGGK